MIGRPCFVLAILVSCAYRKSSPDMFLTFKAAPQGGPHKERTNFASRGIATALGKSSELLLDDDPQGREC